MADIVTTAEPVKETGSARSNRQPIAEPWILGLYGLAGATFVIAAHMARWYGGPQTVWLLSPFTALLGGVAAFLAAMWTYETRNGLATAMLGVWGLFWVADGTLNGLFVLGKLTRPTGAFPELAYWFIVLAAITWMGTVAAAAENAGLVLVFGTLAAGSTSMAIAEGLDIPALTVLAGYLFLVSSVCAWYTATAMMFEGTFGRAVLPIGRRMTTATAPWIGPGESGVLRQAPAARRAG